MIRASTPATVIATRPTSRPKPEAKPTTTRMPATVTPICQVKSQSSAASPSSVGPSSRASRSSAFGSEESPEPVVETCAHSDLKFEGPDRRHPSGGSLPDPDAASADGLEHPCASGDEVLVDSALRDSIENLARAWRREDGGGGAGRGACSQGMASDG